jgi:pyruvate dehydrogenase E2 component (dihydrolipoamide acetyltransferase)
MREFRLPDIGEGLAEAEIVKWHVPVGGVVAVDETVVEVETDKAVVEIPSPFAGVVLRHGGEQGDVVKVGEVLVVIGEPGEATAPGTTPPGGDARPIVGSISEDAVDLTPSPAPSSAVGGRAQALPRARRLARDLGVDLETVTGTGSNGRITEDDVTAAASPGTATPPPRVVSPLVRKLADRLGVDVQTMPSRGPVSRSDVEAAASRGDERRPLSKLRRTIAANLSRSWSEIPQVTAFDDVDATRLLSVRQALQARHGAAIPLDALIVAAVVPVLQAFPEFNASLDGDDLVVHRGVDVGVAVDTPDGLLVATILDAGSKSVLELADAVRDLGERARSRTLAPSELSGQTFTVSNIGAVGRGGHGTPIVPMGTVGILSVGRAADQPVARDGRVEVAPVMPLSLSYDHRVVDGAGGRRFLGMLAENLAEPALFLA